MAFLHLNLVRYVLYLSFLGTALPGGRDTESHSAPRKIKHDDIQRILEGGADNLKDSLQCMKQ